MTETSGNNRHSDREPCFARVMLKNTNTVGYLADMSLTGFKVRIMEKLAGPASEKETVGILFEEIGVDYFELSGMLRWRRDEDKSTLLGYEIESFDSPKALSSYEKIRKEYGDTGSGS